MRKILQETKLLLKKNARLTDHYDEVDSKAELTDRELKRQNRFLSGIKACMEHSESKN